MSTWDDLQHDRKIARHYSTSLMSNTKWRTLFAAIAAADLDPGIVAVKLTGDEEVRTIRSLSFNIPTSFLDSIEFGPVPLVAIEWLEFLGSTGVRAVLEATGKRFPLEETATGLRVVGHRA